MEQPERKHPRLKEYDYSQGGVYFVTICTQEKKRILSHISAGQGLAPETPISGSCVGRGLAPAENAVLAGTRTAEGDGSRKNFVPHQFAKPFVGRGLAPAVTVELTPYGIVAQEQLLKLEERYPSVQIDRYVIMPNHIHMLIRFVQTAGASPRPTLSDVICTYKSITTRLCKQICPIPKLFQTSFHDHVIRGEADYLEISQYIINNPAKWAEDKYYI